MQSALYPTGLAVLVPCHNCAEFIGPCLESILQQDFKDFRVLVADDAILGRHRGCGPPRAGGRPARGRAPGARRAHLMGNIVAGLAELAPGPAEVVRLVDGDDHLLPGAFEAVMAAHRRGFDLVYTDMVIDGAEGSLGAQLMPGVPPRAQLWCFSHLRSFKGYLLEGLDDAGAAR